MNEYDAYYRAFKNYRKVTKDQRNCKLSRKALVTNNPEKTKVEAKSFNVKIDDDWIEEIESKIIYIEKAVKEERQFIRTEGEVIPIEKVKKVSRDSVTHLAKHSNLITKMPKEGTDLIPEKIYMVEKESDYSVYENRFLYYVLIFLKEFIAQRNDAIVKALSTYQGQLLISKEVKSKNKELSFNLELNEVEYENPYFTLSEEEKQLIDRIDSIRYGVDMLLGTNLMVQVAKAPLISLPIVKTNPIKMNNNFKKTLELFEFVNSYKKQGYKLEEKVNTLCPLSNDIADQFSEIVNLSSFLTYQYGTNITEVLQREYELEEERIKQKEKDALAIQIKNLKRKIQDENLSPYEYMLLLEKRNRDLENDCQELAELRSKVIELSQEKTTLEKTVANLNIIIKDKDLEIERLNIKYETDMALQKEKYENEIAELYEKHEEELEELKANHQNELDRINDEHFIAIEEMKSECERNIADAIEDERNKIENEMALLNNEIDNYQNRIDELKDQINNLVEQNRINCAEKDAQKQELIFRMEAQAKDYEDRISEEIKKYNLLNESKNDLDALYLSLRAKHNENINPTDYTEMDKFKDLESSKKALDQLFNASWKIVKKDIRKERLWDKLKEAKKKKNEDSFEPKASINDTENKEKNIINDNELIDDKNDLENSELLKDISLIEDDSVIEDESLEDRYEENKLDS